MKKITTRMMNKKEHSIPQKMLHNRVESSCGLIINPISHGSSGTSRTCKNYNTWGFINLFDFYLFVSSTMNLFSHIVAIKIHVPSYQFLVVLQVVVNFMVYPNTPRVVIATMQNIVTRMVVTAMVSATIADGFSSTSSL